MMNDEGKQNPEARSQEPEEKKSVKAVLGLFILDSGF
jgi:hypothetical protein